MKLPLLLSLFSLVGSFALSRWSAPLPKVSALRPSPMAASRAAKQAAGTSPRATEMEQALAAGDWEAAAKKWAREDPAGFHAWLLRQDPAPDLKLTTLLFTTWVLQDPDAAFAAAVNMPRRFQRDEFIPQMLGKLLDAGTHDERAIYWINQTSGEFSGFTWSNPAFLTKRTPEDAAALLSKLSGSLYGGTLFTQLARKWAVTDLAAARQWVAGLPSALRDRAFDGVMQEWVNQDVTGALHYLATEASTGERHYIYAPLAKLVETDPSAAFRWWEENMGVPDPNTLRHMLGKWQQKDADAVRAYVLGVEDDTLRSQVVRAFLEIDNGKNAAFVIGLPAGEDRDAAAQAISYNWAINDKEGAMNYLNQEAETAIGRSVVSNMVRGLFGQDPAGAFAWALEVPESLRQIAVTAAVDQWRAKDVAAAAAAVSALLPGPVKDEASKALSR